MEITYDTLQCLAAGAGVAVLFWKHREVQDAIENFRNNFPRGGGPPSPRHPCPSCDGPLLRRKLLTKPKR
jgi:hypothetical protein